MKFNTRTPYHKAVLGVCLVSKLGWNDLFAVLAQSLLNEEELQKVNEVANRTQQALDKGEFAEATELWGEAEDLIEEVLEGKRERERGGEGGVKKQMMEGGRKNVYVCMCVCGGGEH